MKVYVESNFVLDLTLLQEQHTSCEGILRLCESAGIQLAIPAYSLVEPYETLIRNHKQRKEIKADLDKQIGQIARTAGYSQRLRGFQNLTALLIDSAHEEAKGLELVRARLLKIAEIIPLEADILVAAMRYQREHDLSPQDAVVYAHPITHK